MSRLTLILGGARSGKSRFAQCLAGEYGHVTYLATGVVTDAEMAERVARHRADRPAAWRTIEEPMRPAAALLEAGFDSGAVLLDCVSFLVSNHLLSDEASCEANAIAELEALCSLPVDLICVSNEVGMSVVPEHRLGRLFRDILGRANQYLAARAEHVYVCFAGLPVDVKRLVAEHGSPAGPVIASGPASAPDRR